MLALNSKLSLIVLAALFATLPAASVEASSTREPAARREGRRQKQAVTQEQSRVTHSAAGMQTPMVGGNTLTYLPHGGMALAHILASLDSAKSSIDVMYYLFEIKHSVSRMFLHHLVMAAERNKANPDFKIRVLLDSHAQSSEDRLMLQTYLKQFGIEVKYFNKSVTLRANNRNHIKFIVVDNQKLITGGRNIADYHFGTMGDPGGPRWTAWYDKDVLVDGPAASGSTQVFNQYWNSRDSAGVSGTANYQQLLNWYTHSVELQDREKKIAGLLPAELNRFNQEFPPVQCKDVEFLADDVDFMYHFPTSNEPQDFFESGGDSNQQFLRKKATKAVVEFLRGTSNRLYVENYAFQPAGRVAKAFADLKQANIPVFIATNKTQDSQAMTDLTRKYSCAFHGGAFQISGLLGTAPGGEHWYRGKGELDEKVHSKVFARDGKDALVTTFNLDARSYHTNWESVLRVGNCAAFARQIEYDVTRTFQLGVAPNPADGPSSNLLIYRLIEGLY